MCNSLFLKYSIRSHIFNFNLQHVCVVKVKYSVSCPTSFLSLTPNPFSFITFSHSVEECKLFYSNLTGCCMFVTQIQLAEVEQASLMSEQLSDKSSSPALPDDLSLDEHSSYQLFVRDSQVCLLTHTKLRNVHTYLDLIVSLSLVTGHMTKKKSGMHFLCLYKKKQMCIKRKKEHKYMSVFTGQTVHFLCQSLCEVYADSV